MGLVELDISLNEEQRAIRDEARKFFMEVWRPAAIQLDKLADPQDVIAKDSVLWDVFRKTYELGYHRMRFPEELGGLGIQDPLLGAILAEEMGYAAADLTISFGVTSFPFTFAAMSPEPALQDMVRQFCADSEAKIIGCWAITEPEHGSDWIWFSTGECSRDPNIAPQLRAVADGDDYIVNGQKAAWVSNGTIATHAALFLSFDPSQGMQGSGIASIPLDLPGITRGKPLNKLGQRALNQGEIFFDDVRIPKKYVVCADPETYKFMGDATISAANGGMGSVFTGLAAAALDEALAYCKERIQGGRPIIEHQSVKARLFDMFTQVEAARSLSRRVAVYNGVNMPPAVHYSIASKIFCTETAFRVSSMAIQLFGGYGLSKDFHIEKIFRDARASMIEDGVNETLALSGSYHLAE
jgi:alkylation response protein AidB-like acyl-CoA dehydrogenase